MERHGTGGSGGQRTMTLSLSHFSAVLLFATSASVVFGITQRSTPRAMLLYGIACWISFIGVVVVVSWLMYFIRH